MTQTPDAERLAAIWLAVVGKLKEVVREHKVTQAELHAAGDYLNRLGQAGMCRSLIDVALAMTSVDALDVAGGGTRPNLEGPYHRPHPPRPNGVLYDAEPPADAPRLTLTGQVREAATGAPAAGAKLDFWQADEHGHYDRDGEHLRGVLFTDAAGRYRIETVLPDDYAEHDHDPIGELFRAMGKTNVRAAHIHLKVTTGERLRLTTQMFLPTSQYLERDYVEGAVSPDLTLALTELGTTPGGALRYGAKFDVLLGAEAG
jgi:protocatechuate 3,4-dioxygenase beta subunit